MKKLNFFIFIIGLILFISYNSYSTLDCYNEGNCENIPWNTRWMNAVLPNFPSCTLTVRVKTRICNLRTQVYIDFFGFYNYPPTDCDDAIDWLWNGNNWEEGESPDPYRIQEFFNYVYSDVMESLFKDATKNYKDFFRCNEEPQTPEFAQYSYFKSSCTSLCWAVMQEGTGGNYSFWWQRNLCLDECCQIKTTYCWDENDVLSTDVEIIPSQNQPNCITYPPPQCDFPDGTIIFQGQWPCSDDDCQP